MEVQGVQGGRSYGIGQRDSHVVASKGRENFGLEYVTNGSEPRVV